MIQYPYQTKAIVHAAQFNSSFPSYDGVSWAKTESASRTTEKMLFVYKNLSRGMIYCNKRRSINVMAVSL